MLFEKDICDLIGAQTPVYFYYSKTLILEYFDKFQN